MTSTPTHHIFVFLEIFSREGGIQSYVKDILQAYSARAAQQGCRAEVLLLRDAPDCDNPWQDAPGLHFRYLKTAPPWLGRVRLATDLAGLLVRLRPQHLYCGHINLATLCRGLRRLTGVPYTVLTYGKEVWEPLVATEQAALQAADGIWTISRYSRDRLCEANQIAPEQVQMLPCVVDGDRFTPGPKPPELLSRYSLHNATVLMTVARLWSGDPYKGVDVTIRALPKILNAYPDVKYLVIGRGDDQPRLAQLASDLGVADRVVFAGFVPTEELPAHYRVADAYIMPSQEGFGIVYLEAMVSGIPALSGDADGSADPLQDGRVGWRVPHRDPEAVAAAVLAILAGDDPRCQGDWLREQALAQFSKPALARQLGELLAH
ncbi:MAG: glycosyltransferase family 4 protein [Spirulinaceae cyanobacterium SM2_1_0]|nr:glycosyltransferase family 4 protein [Spirulinaceae cyanobacterium SM2_1_0]